MTTLMVDKAELTIPSWVVDLDSFHCWTDEPGFPEKANIWWLRGGVWADMSMEQIFSHIMVKGEIFRVLANLMVEEKLGTVLTDGLRLFNEEAELSGKPDLTFISNEARRNGSVKLIAGKEEGFTQLHGSPDMVLEVLSASSEKKDLQILRDDYFVAGIQEYWLVDARKSPLRFDILRRNSSAFVVTRKQAGWVKSSVYRKSFRLVQAEDEFGTPTFRLQMR